MLNDGGHMLYTPVTELTGAKLTMPLQFPILAASCVTYNGTWFSSDGTCVDVAYFLGTFPPFRPAPAGMPCLLIFIRFEPHPQLLLNQFKKICQIIITFSSRNYMRANIQRLKMGTLIITLISTACYCY